MDRYFRKQPAAESAGASPPSEARLFAQAVLGKPVPSASRQEADARARREHLEWLAQISPTHEVKLRSLQRAEASEAQERLKWLAESATVREAEWDSSQHPRVPKGQPDGGQWVAKGGAGSTSGNPDHTGAADKPRAVDQHSAPPAMLELANAWWKTHSLLQQYRRDIETLPARIASEQAKLDSRDEHSNVHWQNLAKAQRDLEIAKAALPKLEAQSHDLEQRYHELGYDEVVYSTWTPGETLVGGRGIEQVGSAVDLGGSPAGLKPTGIEIDIALTAISVLQLGKAALKKALGRTPSNYTAFQGDAEQITRQASASRGLTPNATTAAMTKTDVDIARLSPPDTRAFADPVKLKKLGAFDWRKYTPIEVDKVGDRLIIQNGLTRVEAARQAGIKKLPAYVFENK